MLKTVSSIVNAIGALNYKGTWNASTNTPTLTSGAGVKGDYYQVSVAGSTTLDGISNWGVGDVVAFNGVAWQRIEGGADLNGVNLQVQGNTSLGTTSTESPVTAQTTRYSTHTASGGRQYKLFDMKAIGADNTFQDIINITTPGGFGSANYFSGILGVLRVSVVSQSGGFVNCIATKSYVVRTSMLSNTAISVTLTEVTDFASASNGTITAQAKAGATASLATIEAKFAFPFGMAEGQIMYSFECESYANIYLLFQTPAVA